MNRLWKFAALATGLFLIADISSGNDSERLRIIVMDPLALPLSCACVDGTGQRRYERLAYFLEKQIGQPVEVIFEESLALAIKRSGANADLIIGKKSMVEFDAANLDLKVHAFAALSGRDGGTDVRGVILVRKDSPAKTIGDLAGKKVVLGPEEDAESNEAARALLKSTGSIISVAGSMDSAALAVGDGEADAAAISSFLPPLFEGCGKIAPDSLRILAKTEAVPFITVFATDSFDETKKALIQESLLLAAKDPDLLEALESKNGFVLLPDTSVNWPDWRGPERHGFSPDIPESLPSKLKQIWKTELTGPALSGPAATEKYVVIPDKSRDDEFDLFRCFDALTGKQIWKIEYEAPGEMDYSNSPRATPVIHEEDGIVYLLGAFGDLTCAELETGDVIWELNLFIDFAAETLTWGSSSPPLIVGDKLVINPGAEDASIVALDRHTGETIWKASGSAAAYSAFIFATINSTPQIIGYDSGSLGGWDPENGKRLWTLVLPDASDFNVTTPLIIDGNSILLATENNGARLYHFDDIGKIIPKPVAENFDFAPDTCSPVSINGKSLAAGYGELWCIDLKDGLKMLWSEKDDMFFDHSNFIAGKNRVLIWTIGGDLLLLKMNGDTDKFDLSAKLRPFGDQKIDSMSHPAIVGDRIYLRGGGELRCFSLK